MLPRTFYAPMQFPAKLGLPAGAPVFVDGASSGGSLALRLPRLVKFSGIIGGGLRGTQAAALQRQGRVPARQVYLTSCAAEPPPHLRLPPLPPTLLAPCSRAAAPLAEVIGPPNFGTELQLLDQSGLGPMPPTVYIHMPRDEGRQPGALSWMGRSVGAAHGPAVHLHITLNVSRLPHSTLLLLLLLLCAQFGELCLPSPSHACTQAPLNGAPSAGPPPCRHGRQGSGEHCTTAGPRHACG